MGRLRTIAAALRAGRRIVVAAFATGAAVVAAPVVFVPSRLGFALAGPPVFFPWRLLCVAFARTPSDAVTAIGLSFALCGLAWPLLFLFQRAGFSRA